MPTLILRSLECEETESWTDADTCILEVRIDGQPPMKKKKDVNSKERWVLNISVPFQERVEIILWDEERWPYDDDWLGGQAIGPQPIHRATCKFVADGADYTLWYEVIESGVDPEKAHQITKISLRQMLGRLGQGVLSPQQYQELIARDSIYRCNEVISLRETFQFHAPQDGNKGNTNSVKTWINRHCNPWGEKSVIPLSETPEGHKWHQIEPGGLTEWEPVVLEESRCVAGFQDNSRKTNTDNPFCHETMDWCWYQVLDPPFTYMLDYTSKTKRLSDRIEFPVIQNEWETGSMPIQWRPFRGEYVTVWGRHIFDVGHMPVATEIHPAHTIVREHTTAAPLGDGGTWVPVNRAIIGMGFSGGFLCWELSGPCNRYIGTRWEEEFGGRPDEISGDTEDCWATNLKKHPLKFKLFPPVPRPSDDAVLKYRIVLCEHIQVPDWDKVDDFLELCQNDDPEDGGEDLAFRVWDRARGLPSEFVPEVAPAALRPKLTLRRDAYFDVEVDLTPATQIPVGYYAIVECGWSKKGQHDIYDFEITFEKLRVEETEEYWNEWHLYYGVNGQWAPPWYEPYFDMDGESFDLNTKFQVYTIDDMMPIIIRDCGIEWEGEDWDNYYLDRVEITAPGPNHFDRILENNTGIELLERDGDTLLRFKAKGWKIAPEEGTNTKHEWTIKIVRRRL